MRSATVMLEARNNWLLETREGRMSLDPSYVGKKVFCGECSHRFVITEGMKLLQTLRDRKGKVIGAVIKCEKCGENVFVVADRPS